MAYAGLIAPLPIGQLGFSGTQNEGQLNAGHFKYVNGVDIDGGIILKEGGAEKKNSSALDGGEEIRAGAYYEPTSGNKRTYVFTGGGKLLRDTGDGSFGTTLATGLTDASDPPPMFVAGGRESTGANGHLFFFSGTNQVYELTADGTTMQAISNPAADWTSNYPTWGCLHSFRMWAGGNSNDPHRVYYTGIANHEDYTAGGSLPIYPGEGAKIVGAISYRGVLLVFKYPKGIYVVDTRDPTPANWSVQKLTDAVGAVNGVCITYIDGDIVYMDRSGTINLLSQTTQNGDITTSDIGKVADIGPFIRRAAALSQLDIAQMIYYPIRRQVWIAIPQLGSTVPDMRIIVDLSQPQFTPRFLVSRRDTANSMWTERDSNTILRPVIGDNAGFVWELDKETRSKDGSGYEVRFESASTDLGFLDPRLKTIHKTGEFLEVVSESQGDWDLTVEVYWDEVLTDTVNFNMGTAGATLDSFVLDTDVLGSDALKSDRRKIIGSGRRIKLIGYNSGDGQNVKISEFLLSFVPNVENMAP